MNIQQTEKEISTLEVYLKMKVEQSDWKGTLLVASTLCELSAKLSVARELTPPPTVPDVPDEMIMKKLHDLKPLFVFGDGISKVTLRAITVPVGNQAVCLHKRYSSNKMGDFIQCNNCDLEFGATE